MARKAAKKKTARKKAAQVKKATLGRASKGKVEAVIQAVQLAGSPGITVRDLRTRLGLSQPVMASLIGVSTRQISAIETAQRKPSLQTRRNVNEINRLRNSLAEVMVPEFIGEWLDTPNQAFDGLKPLEVIDRGEIDRIWQMIFYLRSGVSA
ncbi:MAG: helix-turn-helix domain-containing protein [Phycisphaerae bacterium]|nr:helix-turn-helix domain-containing protein [Phycisphaerae bacterium]